MSKLISVKEAADRLSCSEDLLWKWFKTGALRRIKVGRLTRINEQDLDAVVRVGLPAIPAGLPGVPGVSDRALRG